MTQPFDSCRLYFALRDRAWTPDETPSARDRGVVEFERDFEGWLEFGLDREQVRVALERLIEADLVRRMPQPERARREPRGGRLFVEPLDDLTATTILVSRF